MNTLAYAPNIVTHFLKGMILYRHRRWGFPGVFLDGEWNVRSANVIIYGCYILGFIDHVRIATSIRRSTLHCFTSIFSEITAHNRTPWRKRFGRLPKSRELVNPVPMKLESTRTSIRTCSYGKPRTFESSHLKPPWQDGLEKCRRCHREQVIFRKVSTLVDLLLFLTVTIF
jgi:hypothetical protein